MSDLRDKCGMRDIEELVERLEYCRKMLHIHGMMPERENRRVAARIRKEWLRQNKMATK